MARIFLLGPQRPQPNVADALEALGVDGPLAAVTAGWRDGEGELSELGEHTGRPLADLSLYRRAEAVFAADEPLRKAHRARQNDLKALQRLYRIRLRGALRAARRLLGAEGEERLLEPEQRSAITGLRALDRHHLGRIRAIHAAYQAAQTPLERPAVRAERERIAEILARCRAVLIAGGNVAVLLNRMRLFGLPALIADRAGELPVIAWSAGAMVLGERIVLFHDRGPQGRRDPEVLDAGLGLCERIVPLPDAAHRLDRGDRLRLALFARRHAPAVCAAMDNGALVEWGDGRPVTASHAGRITRDGRLRKLRAQ